MATTSQRLTDEQREQRRAQQRELVTASIEQLRSSEGWQRYLTTRAAFRSYSPRNVLLIMLQHPTATRVAGFRAWLKLGYAVQKGETAIRIWAPCPPTKKQLQAWRDAGADPEQRPRTHWRLAAVFAQDQVAELPPPAVPAPLDPPVLQEIRGDSHADGLADLKTLAAGLGCELQIADTGRADGIYHRDSRRIEISDRLEPNGQLAAGIHEIGHALVAVDELAPKLTYAEEELIVESVAYCVCQTLGLATDANSIPYLASWAEAADLEILERAAALTSRLADKIEAGMLRPAVEASSAPATEQDEAVCSRSGLE
jgi:antirestriction protein ArdC